MMQTKTMNIRAVLSGAGDLPSNMVVGSDCKRGHGYNGRMVRYKANGNCVRCTRRNKVKQEIKNEKNNIHDWVRRTDNLRADFELEKSMKEVWE